MPKWSQGLKPTKIQRRGLSSSKKDFLTSYNETQSKFLKDMNIDPELDNFVEFQDISTDTERYIFDYLFSAKCSNPLDIVSNSNFIKFVNFRTGCLQNKLKTMMSFSQKSNISIRVFYTVFKVS